MNSPGNISTPVNFSLLASPGRFSLSCKAFSTNNAGLPCAVNKVSIVTCRREYPRKPPSTNTNGACLRQAAGPAPERGQHHRYPLLEMVLDGAMVTATWRIPNHASERNGPCHWKDRMRIRTRSRTHLSLRHGGGERRKCTCLSLTMLLICCVGGYEGHNRI